MSTARNAVSVGPNQLVIIGSGPKASTPVIMSAGRIVTTGTRIATATKSHRQPRSALAAAAVNAADQSRQAATTAR